MASNSQFLAVLTEKRKLAGAYYAVLDAAHTDDSRSYLEMMAQTAEQSLDVYLAAISK